MLRVAPVVLSMLDGRAHSSIHIVHVVFVWRHDSSELLVWHALVSFPSRILFPQSVQVIDHLLLLVESTATHAEHAPALAAATIPGIQDGSSLGV